MTPSQFRQLALSFPETVEGSHMGHPDFRVKNKIFATISPDETKGMAKLTPDQQRSYMRLEPKVFHPCNGVWGKRGCTYIQLKPAQELTVLQALTEAWRNTAPRKLVEQLEKE
jgi:hypothetical protein